MEAARVSATAEGHGPVAHRECRGPSGKGPDPRGLSGHHYPRDHPPHPGGPAAGRQADRGRDSRPRPAGAAAGRRDGHRHPGQRLELRICGARRQAGADRRALRRQRPSGQYHRPDRVQRRATHRRVIADGRRATAGRLAGQCHHAATRDRRPDAIDPALRRAPPASRRPGAPRHARARHVRRAACDREGPPEHPGLRRHRLRQDHAAQRALRVHSRRPSGSSPSRTPPSCSSSNRTWCAWRPVPRTSRARAK